MKSGSDACFQRRTSPLTRPPVILISPALRGTTGTEQNQSYSLRRNYADAVLEFGGLPVILPYQSTHIEAALEMCDGVILSGSDPGETVASERIEFERSLVAATISHRRPLLGICHGMQVIGQVLGGSLATIEWIDPAGQEPHVPYAVPDRLAHHVDLVPGTEMQRLLGGGRIEVNSFHRHQLTGSGAFVVAARSSEDAVIEGIEGKTPALCLGLQWHPEFMVTGHDRAILGHFITACQRRPAD